MRKTKKPIVVGLAIALVAALGAGATFAWLTDSDEVTNTFTVGNVDISLWEHEYDPETNTLNTEEEVVQENNNYKMVPSVVMPKNPTVTVDANSEDCWLFVKVNKTDNLDEFIEYQIDENNWKQLKDVKDVYYCSAENIISDRNIKVLLNERVKVKDTVTKEMMDALQTAYGTEGEDKQSVLPNLTFTAYAVQKAGVNTPEEAWEKVTSQQSQ